MEAPSYSFGLKHKNFTNNHSPGPKFMVKSSLTRNGMEGSAKVKMILKKHKNFEKRKLSKSAKK